LSIKVTLLLQSNSEEVERTSFVQHQSRNARDKIKSVDNLDNAADELSSEAETVLANMDASMKEVLYVSGWTALDTNSFCLIGLLPRIIRTSQHELFSGNAPYLAAIGGLTSGPVGGGRQGIFSIPCHGAISYP
jgi:hypothetical protein